MDARIVFPDNARMDDTPLFHLERRDAARNMKRFYRLSVERDLFGEILLVREWGRIGRQGRRRIVPHADPDAVHMEAARLARAKRRRGYVEIASACREARAGDGDGDGDGDGLPSVFGNWKLEAAHFSSGAMAKAGAKAASSSAPHTKVGA